MYSTISNPCWTIDVCILNSGRLQQAISRSTVTPAGTDGLYSAWQRKNTWVLGTHGGKKKWALSDSSVKTPMEPERNMADEEKGFCPFLWSCFVFLARFLYGIILLVLSVRLAPVWRLSGWSRGGGWWRRGGLLPPLHPVSFPFFPSTPMHFLHLSVDIFKRESSLTDDANML